MRSALLVFNPTAGRRRHWRLLAALEAALAERGVEVHPQPTAGPGDATEIAEKAVAAGGTDAVVVYGGDGTVREAAKGLLGSDLPLGILPGGTANVLARALGLPLDPLRAAALLPDLVPQRLDVGLCGEEPFLMMASCGLDAVTVRELGASPKKAALGKGSVVLQGLREWWRYRYPMLEVEADGESERASFAAVCNIPLYGGPWRMAPGAAFDDRRLDLVLFRGAGRTATLSFAWNLILGLHAERRDVEIRPVDEVVLGAPEGAEGVCVQIDGDPCGEALPVRVRLAAETLAVLAPGTDSERVMAARATA